VLPNRRSSVFDFEMIDTSLEGQMRVDLRSKSGEGA
jgi:hypothetical protein